MNTSTFSDFAKHTTVHPEQTTSTNMNTGEPHLVVQILSVLAFGAFSIVAVAMAFVAFWVAGLVLAIVLAGIWSGNRTFGARRHWRSKHTEQSIVDVAPTVSTRRSSGNASFDAHRIDMLERLEQESQEFDGFLNRLRDARDATEFDGFMDDRAAKSLDVATQD